MYTHVYVSLSLYIYIYIYCIYMTEINLTSTECEDRFGMSSGHPSPGIHNCVITGELLLRHTSRF